VRLLLSQYKPFKPFKSDKSGKDVRLLLLQSKCFKHLNSSIPFKSDNSLNEQFKTVILVDKLVCFIYSLNVISSLVKLY